MDQEALQILLEHQEKRTSEVVRALLLVVDSLRRQPGFDRGAFQADLIETLARLNDAPESWTRFVIEALSGEIPDEPTTEGPK